MNILAGMVAAGTPAAQVANVAVARSRQFWIQTFLGLEGEVSLWKLTVRVGGYLRVRDSDDDGRFAVGLGFVF